MKQISLTRGKFALVDDENYKFLNQFKWFTEKHGRTFYAVRRGKTYLGKRKAIWMHRIVLSVPPHLETDHKDSNGLNNQRINLRICNHSQNGKHRRKRKAHTSSQYKGVHWDKSRQKWTAQIINNKKHFFLGRFTDEKLAAMAYNMAATNLHGEFALLNNL